MAATYKETRLECDHIALWEHGRVPALGEHVYCVRCNDTRQVVSIPGAFYAVCTDCRWWLRRLTRDSIMANVQQHLEHNQLHLVIVEDYAKQRVRVTYRLPNRLF